MIKKLGEGLYYGDDGNIYNSDDILIVELEAEKDESFEIISEKEEFWRDKLVEAETGYLSAESNLKIFDKIIILSKKEIAKEAKKNKPDMVA